jgi:murein DD-endopeptidase MepM/ murein hydrolase activator NlpD
VLHISKVAVTVVAIAGLAFSSTLAASAENVVAPLVTRSSPTPEATSFDTAAVAAASKAKSAQQKTIRAKKVARAKKAALRKVSLPAGGSISARFGDRSRYWVLRHTGLDFDAPYGSRVRAVMAGTVIKATRAGAYGNLIVIRNREGIDFWYAHLSAMYVRVGKKIQSGQIIGAVGDSGNSTGAHLHLEIRKYDNPVDPAAFLWGKKAGKASGITVPSWVHSSLVADLSDY